MVKIVQRSPLWSISSLIGYLATGKLRQRSSDDLCMSQPSIKSISSQVQWKKPSFLWAISKVITQTIRALWHCVRVASHQFISFPLDTHTAIRRSQKGFHSLLLQPRWCSRRTDTWWHDSSGHVVQEVSSTMIPAPQPKLSELSSAYCTARARVHTVHSRVWRWNSRPTVGAVPLADGAVLPTVLQLSSTLLFDSSLHSPTASCFTTKHEGILCIFACCRTAEWRKLEKATDYQQIWSFLSRTGISVVLLITQSW